MTEFFAAVARLSVFVFLVLLILLPLLVGLIIRSRAASFAARLAPVLGWVSGVTLLATVILIISLHLPSLLRVFGKGAILFRRLMREVRIRAECSGR